MTQPATQPLTLSIERLLDADLERVFAALTDRAQVAQWYAPSDEYTVRVHEWDCRPGGRFRVSMHHTGGAVHTSVGAFREVVPNQRLVQTFAWEGQEGMDTLLTLTLQQTGQQTRLVLTHAGFPNQGARDDHHKGWTGCLARLQASLGSPS